jgi:hypothetical protein
VRLPDPWCWVVLGGVSGPASLCLRVAPSVAPDPSPWRPRVASCPLGQAPRGPPTFLTRLSPQTTFLVDPGRPSGPSPVAVPVCGLLGRSTPRPLPAPPSRGGLPRWRVRSRLRSTWCPVDASPMAFGCHRLHRCHTREAWWVRPDSAGTCTLPETPRFAWRTNARGEPRPIAGARHERTLLGVGSSRLILIEAPSPAYRRGIAGAGYTSTRARGGDLRRFYPQPHQFDCGIDRHARTMERCVLTQDGAIVRHRHMPAGPAPFLQAVAPDREDLVVCVECLFTWDLAGRPLHPRGDALRLGPGPVPEGHPWGPGHTRDD